MWWGATGGPTAIIFGKRRYMADIVNYAKFYVDRLIGIPLSRDQNRTSLFMDELWFLMQWQSLPLSHVIVLVTAVDYRYISIHTVLLFLHLTAVLIIFWSCKLITRKFTALCFFQKHHITSDRVILYITTGVQYVRSRIEDKYLSVIS